MDTTVLWGLAAFVGGGFVGMLVMALMCMAGGLPRQSAHRPVVKGVL